PDDSGRRKGTDDGDGQVCGGLEAAGRWLLEAAPGHLEQPACDEVTSCSAIRGAAMRQPNQRLEQTGGKAGCSVRPTVAAGRSTVGSAESCGGVVLVLARLLGQ